MTTTVRLDRVLLPLLSCCQSVSGHRRWNAPHPLRLDAEPAPSRRTSTVAAAADAPAGAPALRAQVTESGNEISCSVEETNRLRASLGLKPLKIETREEREAAARRAAEEAVRRNEETEAANIRAYLEKRRQQRLLHAKVEGQSLGEELSGVRSP